MPKINYITIPEPCNQNWQEMTIAEKGRFCASCQKDVFDFTNSTDREIATALNKNQNLCGRFNVSQLNRELTVPQEKSSVWMIIATSVISLLGLKSNEVYAQESIKVEQTDSKTLVDKKDIIIKENDSIQVSGTIYEESNIPLPGASIHIKGTAIGTQTDFDGNYKIIVKEGDILVYSFVGFITHEEIISSNSENIAVTLDLEMTLQGLFLKKRTFFGRIFHSIGNIFR